MRGIDFATSNVLLCRPVLLKGVEYGYVVIATQDVGNSAFGG